MKRDNLQIEIIRRIFQDIGISFNQQDLINQFVINDKNLCDYPLALKNDEESGKDTNIVEEKPIWYAELTLAGTVMRLMVTDLSDDEFRDFALVLTGTDLPTYGVRLSNEPEDSGQFGIMTGSSWVEASTGIQASMLSGVEQLEVYSFNWRYSKNNKDMFNHLISFLNAGESYAG